MRKTGLLLVAITLLVAVRADAGKCQWRVAPANIAFGIYSTFGTGALAATTSYTFRCTPQTEAVLTFTTGTYSSTYFPRAMSAGGRVVPYNLYDNAARTVILGDGTGGTTSRVAFNSEPRDKDYTDTIYAATPLGSDVPPGTYTDTVTAILSWDGGGGSSSVTFTVTTIVQAECNVTTVPVAFGTYLPVGTHATTPLDATGSINVYCTAGTVATVSLGPGLNAGGGVRRMAGPAGSFLAYQLYRDAARSRIWSTSPNTVSGTSSSMTLPIGGGLVVYGRVPQGQDPIVGVHTDTVQATVNY